jgi:hypothetical protein
MLEGGLKPNTVHLNDIADTSQIVASPPDKSWMPKARQIGSADLWLYRYLSGVKAPRALAQ